MSINIDPTRQFQFWEYHVSHGTALIRSPRRGGVKTNVDIMVYGIEYLAIPRHLGSVRIDSATPDELSVLRTRLDGPIAEEHAWILASEKRRYPIVAAKIDVRTTTMDIFDSPFGGEA